MSEVIDNERDEEQVFFVREFGILVSGLFVIVLLMAYGLLLGWMEWTRA